MAHRKIEAMTFDEFTTKCARDTIEKKILIFNDDQVLLICGDEGKRKSTFTTATYCEVARKRGEIPNKDFLCYSWEEYRIANLFGLKYALEKLVDKEQAVKLLADYGISDLYAPEYQKIWDKKLNIKKGDILIFDEAGTQINARDAMSSVNKDFNSLMISNRFIGLFHFLNVPKPMSLDVYPREQRARGMVWCCAKYNQDITERKSRIYYYTKDTYSEIFCQKRYWNLFSNEDKLIRAVPPDFEITELGDMRSYIPKDIITYYDARKWAFNVANILNTFESNKNKFDEEKLVKFGESKADWFARTKLAPTYYSAYKLWK